MDKIFFEKKKRQKTFKEYKQKNMVFVDDNDVMEDSDFEEAIKNLVISEQTKDITLSF